MNKHFHAQWISLLASAALLMTVSTAFAQYKTIGIRQLPIQNAMTATGASRITTQDSVGNAWFRSIAGGTGTTQAVLGTIVMRPDWDSGAIKGYDLSGSTGTPGAADYFTYFTSTNYHRGDGMHRLSGSYEKVGGAGFFNLVQNSGTPDSDSGWYDNNDKTTTYKLDNVDVLKLDGSGATIGGAAAGARTYLTLRNTTRNPLVITEDASANIVITLTDSTGSGTITYDTAAASPNFPFQFSRAIGSTYVVVSDSFYRVGGAGFLTLSQNTGSPDADSGWYDVNDKSMNYKLDNADIVKLDATGFTSVLGTNLGTAAGANAGCVKSVFNWDAGNRNLIDSSGCTGTPGSSDNYAYFNVSNYWRGDGLARFGTDVGAPIGSFHELWDHDSTNRAMALDPLGNTVFWGNALPNTGSLRSLGAATDPWDFGYIDHVYSIDGSYSGSLSYKGVQVTTSVSSCPDVNVTTVAAGNFLRWSGSDWYNVALVKAYITDFTEADYVHIAGNEVVSGTKTWTATQTMSELQAAAGTGLSVRDTAGATQIYVGSIPSMPNGFKTTSVQAVDANGWTVRSSTGATLLRVKTSANRPNGYIEVPAALPDANAQAAAVVTYYVDPAGDASNDGLSAGSAVTQVADVFTKVPVGFRGVVQVECADGTYSGFGLNDAIRQGSSNASSPEHGEYDVIVYSASADPTLVLFKGIPTFGPSPPDAVVFVTGSGSLKLLNVGIDCDRQASQAGFCVGPRARGHLDGCNITNVGNMGHGVYVWGGHVRLSNTIAISANVADPNSGWGILARSDGFVYADADATFTRVGRTVELEDMARLYWNSGSFTSTGSAGSQNDYGIFMGAGSSAMFYCPMTISEVFVGVAVGGQSRLTFYDALTIANTNEPSPSVGVSVGEESGIFGPLNGYKLSVDNFELGIIVSDGSFIDDQTDSGEIEVKNCSTRGITWSGGRIHAYTFTYSGNAEDVEQGSFGTYRRATHFGGIGLESVTATSDTTLTIDEETVVLIDASGGNVTVNFPVRKNRLWKCKATTAPGGNTITLQGVSGNIDGAASNTTKLQAQHDACEVWCDGTDFWLW